MSICWASQHFQRTGTLKTELFDIAYSEREHSA